MRCRYRLSYFCLCSSAGSTGTSLASQNSRLNTASFCCLPASIFSFCFIFFQKKSLLFQNFALFSRCTSTLSSSICRKHSAARRNQPRTKQQSKYVTTRARQRKQADRVGRRALTQLAAFSRRTKTSKYSRQKCTTTHKTAEARVIHEGLASISNLSKIQHCSLSILCMYFVHACGVRVVSWSMEFLDLCKSSVCT